MKPSKQMKLSMSLWAVLLALVLACDPLSWLQQPTPVGPGTPSAVPSVSASVTPPAGITVTGDWITQRGSTVRVAVTFPRGWVFAEKGTRITVASSAEALAGAELEGPALVVSQADAVTSPDDLLAQVKLQPNEITRREDTTLGGESARLVEAKVISPVSARGYRMIVVAALHGGKGYLVTASTPLEQWDKSQANLLAMIKYIAFY